MSDTISQAQIEVVEFPRCVRIRRGMYISNLNQYVTEIVDNSVDEHVAGHCSEIAVIVQKDENNKYTFTIKDNGRGIPITEHPKYPGQSQVEIAFTTLHGKNLLCIKLFNCGEPLKLK